jgi:hypothetical protein
LRQVLAITVALAVASCIGDQGKLVHRDAEVDLISEKLTVRLSAASIAYPNCAAVCPKAAADLQRSFQGDRQALGDIACAQLPANEASWNQVVASLKAKGWIEYTPGPHGPAYYRLDSCLHLGIYATTKEYACEDREDFDSPTWIAIFGIGRLDPCEPQKDGWPIEPRPLAERTP